MRTFSFTLCLYFLLINFCVYGNRCHRNVDLFIKKIFKGVKLSLDQDDLVALTDMKKGSCALTSRIYFSAYLTTDIAASSLKQYQPMKYTDVVTNEGGGYNPKTGEFTVPRSGGYTFFWEFLIYPGSRMVFQLDINGQKFAHNYAIADNSENRFELGSKSTIINLTKGDKVRVVYASGNGKLYGYHRYTGFSGFIL